MSKATIFGLVKTIYEEYSIHCLNFNIMVAIKRNDEVTPLYYASATSPQIPSRSLDDHLGTGKMIIVGISTYSDVLNIFNHPLSDLTIVICHKRYEDNLEKIIASTDF